MLDSIIDENTVWVTKFCHPRQRNSRRNPCTIHFECLKKWSKWLNSSSSTHKYTSTRSCWNIYPSLWELLVPTFRFSSNLTGHHETKTAKPVWRCRSKYSIFILNLGYLWLTRVSWLPHLPSRWTPATLVIQVRTLPHSPKRTFIKRRTRASFQISASTNVDSFRQNEITKMTPNSAPTDFANFGRRYFHF
jgi:hypothetical protein